VRLLVFYLIALSTTSVFSQDKKLITDLFQNHDRLNITLTFDLDSLINDVGEERGWHKGTISWERSDGVKKIMPIKAKTRGNFRRNPKNCSFPPLLLRSKKEDRRGTRFSKYKDLDLVTHCQDEEEFGIYVLKEYLVYRLYNLITDYSYKVKLLQVNYQNKDGESLGTYHGFFIEENDELKDRIPARDIKTANSKVNQDKFTPSIQLSLFQYMIGNTDWNVPYEHNIKLLEHEVTLDTLMVPYDFDHSGFVNSSYASAYRTYQLESPRERYYVGECYSVSEVWNVAKGILDRKKEIRDLIDDFPYLPRSERKDLLNFINPFLVELNDVDILEQKILSSCGLYH